MNFSKNIHFLSFVSYSILSLFLSTLTAADFKITGISFINNKAFTTSQLSELIHSQEKDNFDTRLVKLDKILLSNYYRKHGFLTCEVLDSLILQKSLNTVYIYYKIYEGRRYYYNDINFAGNQKITSNRLNSIFNGITKNSPFDESLINEGKKKVEDLYYNNGKPFVDLKLDYEFEQDTLVHVKFSIKENHTVYIKDIKYIGLKVVKSFLIRRELDFKKGDLYNRQKLGLSQQNIYSTGLFDYIRFEIKSIPDDTSHVILNILVKERDPRWIGLRVGFAYEQEEAYGNKLEFTAEGGHRNLFGTARSISLHLIPSFIYDLEAKKIVNPENQVTFSFVEPWIGYTRTPGVFQLSYHQYRPVHSADFNVFNSSFNMSRKYGKEIEAKGAVGAKFVNLLSEGFIDSTLESDVGKDQIYSLSLYVRKDTRNNFFNPTSGSLSDASLTFSYTIGKTQEGKNDLKRYFTLVSSWQRYQPLKYHILGKRSKVTFATRLKSGFIFELGNTRKIPISDLFFAGGATSVRGYREQLLGPAFLNSLGYKSQAIGGKLLLLMNAELRIPLYWVFVGEVFLDGGNVWSRIDQFTPAEVKFTTGLGIALITPIGPIRFDYGMKLMKEASDKKNGTFHLGFYFAF